MWKYILCQWIRRHCGELELSKVGIRCSNRTTWVSWQPWLLPSRRAHPDAASLPHASSTAIATSFVKSWVPVATTTNLCAVREQPKRWWRHDIKRWCDVLKAPRVKETAVLVTRCRVDVMTSVPSLTIVVRITTHSARPVRKIPKTPP